MPLPAPKRSDRKKEGKRVVKNHYEHLPTEFVNSFPNPYFSDHSIPVPFRGLIVAPAGSGKVSCMLLSFLIASNFIGIDQFGVCTHRGCVQPSSGRREDV